MLRTIRVAAADLAYDQFADADADVRFTDGLAETVAEMFSAESDRILDPFAGFGTTLVVSERMGRTAVGVELLPERVSIIRERLGSAADVVQGDARDLDRLGLGTFQLCLRSPPYMNAVDHPENPLTGYRTLDGSYPVYLGELSRIFESVAGHLEPNGHLVINAANICTGDVVTPLAWDIARVVSRHLAFQGEIYIDWDTPPASFSGDYCLVFRQT